MFRKEKLEQLEMIISGLLILNANMESYMKEIRRERVRLEQIITQLEDKMSNKPKMTYL